MSLKGGKIKIKRDQSKEMSQVKTSGDQAFNF